MSRALSALVLAAALLAALVQHFNAPALTIVGNVTIDVVDGKRVLGGAVSYAAAVVSAWGQRACIVTANAADADLGNVFKGHDLVVIPSDHTLVFEHTYTFWGNHRKLRVTAQPNVTLTAQHLPARCQRARTLLLGPLMPQDMDPSNLVQFAQQPWWQRALGLPGKQVGLMAQGLQRQLDASGRVKALSQPSPQLEAALGSSTLVFLSDVETEVWPNGTVSQLAARTHRFLVTRGEQGADEHTPTSVHRVPVAQVDNVLDTNGAGDTFATAYMLAAAAGHPSPISVAHWAGAVAVSQPQVCKPACITGALQQKWHTMPSGAAEPRGWLRWLPALPAPGMLTSPLVHLAQMLGLAAPRSSSPSA